jgi:AbrB family looped-hinge helix DNA binding protein
MNKIYKVLGKKGVVVIPYELREKLDLNYNDVISFTPRRDGSIVIRKEELCDNCIDAEDESMTLEGFLDALNEDEQRDALVHLTAIWAERRKGRK